MSFAVKSPMFRTVIHWIFRGMSWRAVLIRIALLTAVWLVVAFVFATEFYLSARGMPLKISWTDAARNAFRDWFPWMLLSPVAVILAGRFRFDRGTWRRSLMIHLAACFLFTIAYEALLLLAYPAPFVLSTGGVPGGVGIFSTADGGLPGVPSLDVKILPSPGTILRADRRLPGSPGFPGSVHAVDPSSSPLPTRSTDVPFDRSPRGGTLILRSPRRPGWLRELPGSQQMDAVFSFSCVENTIYGSDLPVHCLHLLGDRSFPRERRTRASHLGVGNTALPSQSSGIENAASTTLLVQHA
jgi:hypothetical protein